MELGRAGQKSLEMDQALGSITWYIFILYNPRIPFKVLPNEN
jgi:hypothetical protein